MIEKYDLRCSCLQTLNKHVSAGDGGAGVPSLFDGMNDDDDASSLDTKKSTATKTLDLKAIHDIAAQMKHFNQHGRELQLFEGEQKQQDRNHSTSERVSAEMHATKERIKAEIANLERDKHGYEWQLVLHNAKRQRLDEEDSTATAMNAFISGIATKVEEKRTELAEVNCKLTGMMDTPQKSNCTP